MKKLQPNFMIFMLASCFLLNACSSAPENKSNYYLLNSDAHKTIPANADSNKKPLILNALILPEYLNQPSLIIKRDNHQLHFSRYHLWAENLQASSAKILENEFNQSGSKWRLISQLTSSSASKNLTIQIDHFYSTEQSKVILAGKYWLVAANKNLPADHHPFYFELPLQQDGYAHSVAKMRELLNLLANQLSTQLDKEAFE